MKENASNKVRCKIVGTDFERTARGCYNSRVPYGSSASAVLLRGIPAQSERPVHGQIGRAEMGGQEVAR
jgi:hypothetical protein